MGSIPAVSYLILILALSTSSSPVSNVTDNPSIAISYVTTVPPKQLLVNNSTFTPTQFPLVKPVSLYSLDLKKDTSDEEIYLGDGESNNVCAFSNLLIVKFIHKPYDLLSFFFSK